MFFILTIYSISSFVSQARRLSLQTFLVFSSSFSGPWELNHSKRKQIHTCLRRRVFIYVSPLGIPCILWCVGGGGYAGQDILALLHIDGLQETTQPFVFELEFSYTILELRVAVGDDFDVVLESLLPLLLLDSETSGCCSIPATLVLIIE